LLQVPLWGELRSCQVPLLLVAGQLDSKFAGIKRRMMARLRQGLSARAAEQQQQEQQQQQHVVHQWAEVPGVGHAVHVEAPLQLLQLIKGFTETL
jgi:isochorismate synthase/2-succinyl-5-enolpyruvyl-6-hydroxy-3-cyclohexene-1-carboxylate synthase/2-succinyl-6-hydroxy-2,4-cyclohexadiene-1-carboxylate synthase/O-succinylbenzoate synthase